MCVPKSSSRNNQKEIQKNASTSNTREVLHKCALNKQEEPLGKSLRDSASESLVESVDKPVQKPVPKLIMLEVTGATPLGGNRYWALRDDVSKVRIKAVTDPPDTPVAWTGGTPTGSPIVVELGLKNVADVPVKATLDCDKSVTIEIYDLVTLDCALPKKLAARRWKAYKSDKTTRLTATTNPDLKKVWDLLVWSEGTPAAANVREVALQPVGDRTVTVALGYKKLAADLHICQWPLLKIKEVTFECHTVLNDGRKEIDVPFDKKWKAGRNPPAANQKAADSQSPICFTRGKKIKLSAVFEVTEKATDDETVSVKGDMGYGEVTADVSVKAGADEATMALTESAATLPSVVHWDDAWEIAWTSVLQDGTTWVDADASEHLLYVLFGDPKKDIYFTLLDISCRGAKGKRTESDFIEHSFEPYKSHTGDNKGFQRKGDGVRLSYYKTGYRTKADDSTWTPRGMLSSSQSTGRCGGWVEFLLHMWAIHGVTAVGQRWYIRAVHPDHHDNSLRFQVKNLTFNVGTLVGLYSHTDAEVTKVDGVPGQGKTNPQFDFSDHVIATYNGKLFDPSYGVGPYLNDKDYLKAALAGLGKFPPQDFVLPDRTPQFIAKELVPYSKGFAQYTIAAGETLADIALEFGISTADILLADHQLKAKRLTADKVVPGDVVRVAGHDPRVLKPAVTFDMIANAHGLSKQAIFDDVANASLKSLRKTVDKVVAGDKIVISWKLIGDGTWVIGHPQ